MGTMRIPLRIGGKVGFVDEVGNICIAPQFAAAGTLVHGRAVARLDGKSFLIDSDGREVSPRRYDGILLGEDDILVVVEGKRWGYARTDGRVIAECQWDSCGPLSESLGDVYNEGKGWYVDRTGTRVGPTDFDQVGQFNCGVAWVRREDRWAVMPRSFAQPGRFEFAHPGCFSNGLDVAQHDGEQVIVNLAGEIVARPDAVLMSDFREGVFSAFVRGGLENERAWGYVDHRGEWVIGPAFERCWGFRNGIGFVSMAPKKCGAIDRNGKLVVESRYDSLWGPEAGRITFRDGQETGLLDLDGNELCRYGADGQRLF